MNLGAFEIKIIRLFFQRNAGANLAIDDKPARKRCNIWPAMCAATLKRLGRPATANLITKYENSINKCVV